MTEFGEWVRASCGCVWRESRPPNARIDPQQPRACVVHMPDHPAAVGTSPQGLGLFMVTYHDWDPR